MKASDGLKSIGQITKAFGIKGEVIVKPVTDATFKWGGLKQVFIADSHGEVTVSTVESMDVQARGVRMKLRAIPDRTTAERLVGAIVSVKARKPGTSPGKNHGIGDLIGFTASDADGRPLGVIKTVSRMPAQDLLVIDRDGRELMVPAVREFVISVDHRARTVTLKLIDGMLEL